MPKPSEIAADKPLKIGLVLDDTLDTPDGVQQYVLTLGAWLTAQGHQVCYLVGETIRSDVPHIHSLSRNVKVRFNGNRMSIPLPAGYRKLRVLLQAEQFDVLHIQVPYSPMLGARIIKSAGPRTAIVGTFHVAPHSGVVHHANRLLAASLRRSLQRFDNMVSVSSAAQQFATNTFHVETGILPNVFEYEVFHQAVGWPQYNDNKLTVMFLGRLVPRKGCQTLLEAVALLSERSGVPAFRVIVCGKGPLAASLHQYAAKHGLSETVEFTGFVSEADKPRYYASADITVFPSSGGESFGIVLLEAMASGQAAVLAGDNPGYHSVMAPQPDLLFDPFAAAALADKLATYLQDAERRDQARRWGEQYAAGFDTDVVGPKMVAVYRKALRKRREP